MKKIKDHSLYLIISEEYGRGRSALEIAKSAIAGGIDIIQLREKKKSEEEILKTGKELLALCKKNKVTFIMNDDPYLAKKAGADGVHMGEEDVKKHPLAETRRIIGSDKIIGLSTHSIKKVKEASPGDIDYIAFGPIFPTTIKDYSIGTKDIKKVLEITEKPIFFIGGIDISNIGEILKLGGKNIAVIRGISQADDITEATKKFKEKIYQRRKG
ncbi:MAG: thiamine phosphate synthase [Candidatus Omnitrophica bacterium]|nr:thiamine phosphate synthase [Candidatus Omnitrophota bacterium]